jgi:hypothetical protein
MCPVCFAMAAAAVVKAGSAATVTTLGAASARVALRQRRTPHAIRLLTSRLRVSQVPLARSAPLGVRPLVVTKTPDALDAPPAVRAVR